MTDATTTTTTTTSSAATAGPTTFTSAYSRPGYASEAVALKASRRAANKTSQTTIIRRRGRREKTYARARIDKRRRRSHRRVEHESAFRTRTPHRCGEIRCTNSDNLENTSDVIDKVVSSKTHPWHLGEIFESSSYTQQMCMASATSLTAPVMGVAENAGVAGCFSEAREYVELADADASNYKIVNNFTDVVPDEWFTMTKPPDKTVCLGYSNANGGWYRSP